MVYAEKETVGMIRYGRPVSGIAICVFQILALDDSLGVTAGNVIEVAAHHYRPAFPLYHFTDKFGLSRALPEGSRQFAHERSPYLPEILRRIGIGQVVIESFVVGCESQRLKMKIKNDKGKIRKRDFVTVYVISPLVGMPDETRFHRKA